MPVRHGRIIASGFRPHPLLAQAHLQTALPTLLRPLPPLHLDIERWERPDGDFVDIGWFERPQAGQPLAVLVHGLTGGFESKYLRATAARLRHAGWAGLILQLRGAGPEPNRLARNYHQGDTADLIALLQRLREAHPETVIASLGWSLGGNIVLKAAGELGEDHPADLVTAASVPFRLEPCAQRLRQGASRIYQRRLLRDLKAMVQRKHAAVGLPEMIDVPAMLSARDFFDFDDAWTAPLHGFDDALDYYRRCECGPYLRTIQRPTLIVHSRDDPFMSPDILPSDRALGPDVTLELSEHGGHVGFVGRNAWGGPLFWLERRLADWLQQQLARCAAVQSGPARISAQAGEA